MKVYYTKERGILFWEQKDVTPETQDLSTLTYLEIEMSDLEKICNQILRAHMDKVGGKWFFALNTGSPHRAISKIWEMATEKELRITDNREYSLQKHSLAEGIVFTKIEGINIPFKRNLLERLTARNVFAFHILSEQTDFEQLNNSIFHNPKNVDFFHILRSNICDLVFRFGGSNETYFALQFFGYEHSFFWQNEASLLGFDFIHVSRDEYISIYLNKLIPKTRDKY